MESIFLIIMKVGDVFEEGIICGGLIGMEEVKEKVCADLSSSNQPILLGLNPIVKDQHIFL